MRRVAVTVVCGLLLLALAAAGDKKPDQYAEVHFTVLKDDNGKPIRNAAIVLHEVDKDGHQSRGGYELKTDAEGKTFFSGVPYGKLRVQVIVRGFQTYGDDFNIDQPKHEITVKLKRPQQQYSIYDK